MKKIFFLIGVLFPILINAQDLNLIQNGGFENTRSHLGQTKFDGWIFDRYLYVEKSTGYKGNNAVKLHTNQSYFRLSKAGEYNVIDIKGGSEYKLSFWHKGKKGIEAIEPIITWYDANGDILSNEGKQYLGSVNVSTNWTEKSFTFVAPSIVESAGLAFKVYNSGEVIHFDEVFLKKTKAVVSILPPTGIKMKAFQREIVLSWHKGKPGSKWEVEVNGDSKMVFDNKYILTNLMPKTDYNIRIRTILGDEISDFSEDKKITTKPFTKVKDDPLRVPYLRTLKEEGTPNQKIDLFYNDLYNIDAKITYMVDEKQVEPQNNQLVFPHKGKQQLKVIIKEAKGYEWEFLYKLNVK